MQGDSYQGGIDFKDADGGYVGSAAVAFNAFVPELEPQFRLSVHVPGGAGQAFIGRDLAPDQCRELAKALEMAADAADRARAVKAA